MKKVIAMPVKGYENAYVINSNGDVTSMDRQIKTTSNTVRFLRGKTLKLKQNNYGYLYVTLSNNGKTKNKYLHRLLAEAFILNPDNKQFVNHKDGNPQNNSLENLEWVTHAENIQHAYDKGLSKNQKGDHFMAVGVVDNTLGREFPTIKEWCKARGINYSTGRNVLSGCNKSKTIELNKITVIKNKKNG